MNKFHQLFLVYFTLLICSQIRGCTSHKLSNPDNLENPFQATTGKVFLIGGAASDDTASIYNALRESTGKENPTIAVAISGASSLEVGLEAYYDPIPGSKSYEQLFFDYGFTPSVIRLALDNYQTASNSESPTGSANIDSVRNADVIFFNGGDQSRHSRSWLNDDGSDSEIMQVLRQRFSEGLVIAGSSAGAAIQSDPTYGEGNSYGYYYFNADLKPCEIGESLVDDREGTDSFRYDVNGAFMKGFGFLNNLVVDTHFDARGRIGRLPVAMKNTGNQLGIGVGEDTALFVNGDLATAYGNDGVWIFDSSNAVFPREQYFTAEGLRISYLTEGDTYTFTSKGVNSTKALITVTSGNAHESNDIFYDYEGINSIKSLVKSTADQAVGISYSRDPTAKVVFFRGQGELSYQTGNQYTVDKMLMEIGTY